MYTNLNYIENFIKRMPTKISLQDYLGDTFDWNQKMFDLIFKKSNLYLEDSGEELATRLEKKDLLAESLLLLCTQSGKINHFKEFSQLRTNLKSAVSKISSNSFHCYNKGLLDDDSGYIKFDQTEWVANIKKITKNKTIIASGVSEDNQFDGWNKLISKSEILPRNSAIIYDPYLLKFPLSKNLLTEKKNFCDVLDLCIPDDLNIPYHLSIISSDPKDNLYGKQQSDKEQIFAKITKDIKTHLKKSKPNIKEIQVQILISKNLHERGIISNYFWIRSGHSLNIVKPKGKTNKDSTLINYSTINGLAKGEFRNILKEFTNVIENSEVFGNNFVNRLTKYDIDMKKS